MILVLASRWDASAAALASRWHAHGVRLLTPVDLSRPGWRWDPANPLAGTLAVGPDIVPVHTVRRVVSVLSTIQPRELPHIATDDRDYVAAEVSAFLVAWLTSLGERVLNPPTPLCLNGPHLRDAQWRRDAALAGLSVATTRRQESVRPGDVCATTDAGLPPGATREVAVVGGSCVAAQPVPPITRRGLEDLAAVTGAGLLTAHLHPGITDGAPWRFDGARTGVDLTAPDVAGALARCLGVAS